MHRGWRDLTRRGAGSLLLVVLLLSGLPAVAGWIGGTDSAPEPTILHPDLRTLPPSELFFDKVVIRGKWRWVLRFTNTVWNAGAGPLELRGDPATGRLRQVLSDDAGGFVERTVPWGAFVYHPAHDHWHFRDFAEYVVRDRQRKKGDRLLRRGAKTSFCIRDTDPVQELPGSPESAVYGDCGQDVQGLSVGWGDTYSYGLVDQWVLLGRSRLPNGRYMLHSLADPRNLLGEGSRERNNDNRATVCFAVNGLDVVVIDCLPAQ